LTLKNLVVALFMFFIFFTLKKTMPVIDIVLNFDDFIVTVDSDLFPGLMALLLRFPIKGLVGDIFETIEQDILFKNPGGSGEGSSTGGPSGSGQPSGSGGSSGSGGPTGSGQVPYKKVISESDYEYETGSEGGGNSPVDLDDPFGGSKSMGIIYGNENIIKSATKEELEKAIETIDNMKDMHRDMQAPASESEIKRLTKKEDLCREELEKRSSEGEKESNLKDGKDKGKGKEKSN